MTDTFKSGPDDVEIIEREQCFSGFYRLDRLQLRHRLFSGGMGRQLERELFVRHDAVCVLPYDPRRDEVVLIEQFRVGAIGKVDNPWLIELVAGLIDKNEQPEEVARREAIEEAGLEVGELWPVTTYFHRRAAVLSACTFMSGIAIAPMLAVCSAWTRRVRISVYMSGRCSGRCRPCAMAASTMPRASSRCSGWL